MGNKNSLMRQKGFNMFNGKFLRDMSKEELVEVIVWMEDNRVSTSARAEREREMMLGNWGYKR